MPFYLTALSLVLHTYFWGAGLALLALPRVWRRYWWAFAPCCGLALQSAVVWAGTHTSLAGTNRYAWASEVLPLGLNLIAIIWRWRPFFGGFKAAAGTIGVMLVAGWMLISPMAKASRELTTLSIGSCDHADYAAGARVFQEFSRDDRTGLMGQTEVTSVGSTKTFFDFWLRLNHFTPSALLAHNATILGLAPWQLAGLTGAVIAILNLPAMVLLGRKTIGLRGGPLLLVVALYGLSPLVAWAVDQGALAQIYASLGITTLTLLCFASAQAARFGVRARHFTLLTAAGIWLLAGSYNFILLVAFAPGCAWLLVHAIMRRDLRPAGRTLLMIAAAFACCVPLFWGRFDGIAERMRLFDQYHFGWPIPLLTPEGWLGLVSSTDLAGWPAYPRIVAVVAVVGLWIAGVVKLWRRRRRRQAAAAVVLVLPVAVGWGILTYRSQAVPTASYDAFKVISVFLPCLISGLLCWLAAVQRRQVWQLDATVALVAILVGNSWASHQFQLSMAAAPLRVDSALSDLAQLERDPQLESFNLLIQKYWDRLWANHFLLGKPHYFKEATYEGRRPTALKGRWSLFDEVKNMSGFDPQYYRTLNGRFQLLRDDLPGRVDVEFATGWYGMEKDATGQWRWSAGDANIVLRNPTAMATRGRLRMQLRGLTARTVYLLKDGLVTASALLSTKVSDVDFGEIDVPPGPNRFTLSSDAAAVIPVGTDKRTLSFSLHLLKLDDQTLFGGGAAAPVTPLPVVQANLKARIDWSYGENWYAAEADGVVRWRWSAGRSTIKVSNSLGYPVNVKFSFTLTSAGNRELQLLAGSDVAASALIGPNRREYAFGDVVLESGVNEFTLQSPEPPQAPEGRERRNLSFALWKLAVRIMPSRHANAERVRVTYEGKAQTPEKARLEVEYGNGWYREERLGEDVWRWSSGDTTLRIFNPQSAAVTVQLKLRLASSDERTVRFFLGGVASDPLPISRARVLSDLGTFTLQPGYTELRLVSPETPSTVPNDRRKLSFALYEAVIEP